MVEAADFIIEAFNGQGGGLTAPDTWRLVQWTRDPVKRVLRGEFHSLGDALMIARIEGVEDVYNIPIVTGEAGDFPRSR